LWHQNLLNNTLSTNIIKVVAHMMVTGGLHGR